jgi:hypothetical protein
MGTTGYQETVYAIYSTARDHVNDFNICSTTIYSTTKVRVTVSTIYCATFQQVTVYHVNSSGPFVRLALPVHLHLRQGPRNWPLVFYPTVRDE